MSAQRVALDLQHARDELARERERNAQLLDEMHRQSLELDRLRHSVRRESNSRLQVEEALDKTRERLQLAVDAAGLALWDWLLAEPYVFLSERWGEMIGDLAVEGYWEIDRLRESVHPEDLPHVLNQMYPLLKGHTQRAVAHYRVRTALGWRWLETHGTVAERARDGRAIRLMGTHADVTIRKEAEQATLEARDLALQASRTKSEFLANISHEVRTPLNAVMGLTQLLMGSPLNSEQQHWLELMSTSSRALLSILDDILDFSRIEAGKMAIERVPFDIRHALEEIAAVYAEQARSKSLQWHLSLPENLPSQMEGDPGRLRQVLYNLLSNALKFTPANGRIEVTVRVYRPSDSEIDWLAIDVRDTGIGIAPKQQALMFDAFTQADTSTARQYGGSGLGLAISLRLTQLMGGNLSMNSTLGKGSTFTVQLPMPTPDPSYLPTDLALSQSVADQHITVPEALIGTRVLVAEDHPINQALMKELMKLFRCEILIASDGAQAVAQWLQHHPQLILMDIQMPGINGFDATRQIRQIEREQHRPRTPIIALTANAMGGARQQCLEAGMDDYVSKPIRRAQLLQAMLQAIGQPTAEQRTTTTSQGGSSRDKVSQLLRDLIEDPDSAATFIQAVDRDLPHRVNLLAQALAEKNAALAKEQAHLLCNSLALISAEREARLARGLEMAANAGEWGLFAKALPLLQENITQLREALTSTPDSSNNNAR
jgi:signal transduction histidine kinase/DNA-binding response OmpR family regulator